MKYWLAVLLLVTVLDLLLICQALDDDEDEKEEQKYSVTFFQFKPKDLGILGHKKNHFKRDIKRNEIDTLAKPTNNTVIEKSNATIAKSSNESSVPSNSTSALVNQTVSSPAVNATKLIQNVTESHAKDNTTSQDISATPSDVNIMNALIDLAVQKNISSTNANKTEAHKMNNTSNATPQKTNATVSNATNALNKTKASDANATKRNYISLKRNKVLNPNPKPSDQEAELNVKPPKQLENKEHDSMIHSDNTTKVDVSEDKHETTTNSVEMVKNPNPEGDKATEQNVTATTPEDDQPKKIAKDDTTAPTTKEDEEQKKIAKDKETNKEILGAAKDIKPVTNNVGSVLTEVHDIMKESVPPKSASARTKVHHSDHPTDEKTIKHRKSVAEFVPLYHKTTPKDHKLSFQVGSMKHPKHNIHPKCHACPLNSTYKECVKRSTLRQCNEGLNNICFTKSTKKAGIVTYEMGCADHNNCVHAKAFPCKDGREHCFTCCQFDRCNSSPHHGDYELDELNLAELSDSATSASFKDSTTTLDTKSASQATTATWMAYASTLFVLLFPRL